jgi:MYXO-CTERM domain-containing protein
MSNIQMRASTKVAGMRPLGLVLALGFFAPLQAFAVCTVDVNGTIYSDFSQAYDAAGSGDTMSVTAGPCNESLYIEKNLTIIGTGVITLNSSSGAEVLRVAQNFDLTLENLTIRGGTRRGITADGNNDIVLDDVDIDGDSTGNGGVLSATDPSSITIRDSKLAGSGSNGGAIYATKGSTYTLLIEDTEFADSYAGLNGGAIYASNANLTCTRCTFDGTSSVAQGGAIYATNGSFSITQSLFCDTNSIGSSGGALYASPTTASTLRSSRFVETGSSGDGGALYILSGTWTVENNHFLGIGAGAGTGAIEQIAGTTTLRNNLFLDNTTPGLNRGGGSGAITYNWWQNSTGGHSSVTLDSTNYTDDGSPQLVSWSKDNNCANDSLWPTPIDSPLLDIGDGSVLDPDGTRSDIGAYGGSAAEVSPYHDDADADGDAFFHDCDDDDEFRSENQEEVCDTIDNDCNNVPDDDPIDIDRFYQDCDGDEQGDADTEVVACFEPAAPSCPGGVWLSLNEDGSDAWTDCNDADADSYLGADETCAPGDQSCEGDGDEGAIDANVYYADEDGDSYGGATIVESCDDIPPGGSVVAGGDCDDNDDTFYPGAPDICGDDIDTDCNGGDGDDASVVAWYPDEDGDGFGDALAAPILDCGLPSAGYVEDSTDCDDGNSDVNPDGVEICNELDDDCNDFIDDAGPPLLWYPDEDGDGFGNPNLVVETACPPEDYIETAGDCNDLEEAVHPEAVEICNDIDDDCDDKRDAEDDDAQGIELVWNDWDQDNFGSCSEDAGNCEPFAVCSQDISADDSYADNPDDCDDYNPLVFPGAEEIGNNNIDENCDGQYAPGEPLPTDEAGCNCSSTPGLPGLAVPWLGLALIGLRRRRS